jgi:hypothetical protein
MIYTAFFRIEFSDEERAVVDQIRNKLLEEDPCGGYWTLHQLEGEVVSKLWVQKVIGILEKYYEPKSPVAALLDQFYQMLGSKTKNVG